MTPQIKIILLFTLIASAYSNAVYPSKFFLKGPISKATIYGVDGSQITSVADAGSISSEGDRAPTAYSYQNTGSNNFAANPGLDCTDSAKCGQSNAPVGDDTKYNPSVVQSPQDVPNPNSYLGGSGVVIQGPSMSATIKGPSVGGSNCNDTSSGNNAQLGSVDAKQELPNNQRQYYESPSYISPTYTQQEQKRSCDSSSGACENSANVNNPTSATGTHDFYNSNIKQDRQDCGSSGDCGRDSNGQTSSTYFAGYNYDAPSTGGKGSEGSMTAQDNNLSASTSSSPPNQGNYVSSTHITSSYILPSSDSAIPCDSSSTNCNPASNTELDDSKSIIKHNVNGLGANIQGPLTSSSSDNAPSSGVISQQGVSGNLGNDALTSYIPNENHQPNQYNFDYTKKNQNPSNIQGYAYTAPSHEGIIDFSAPHSNKEFENPMVITGSNVGFNKRGNSAESSSFAPPTYAIPENNLLESSDAVQNTFGSNLVPSGAFESDGKHYDCYIIQIPVPSYGLPGEYSVLLKKLAQISSGNFGSHSLHCYKCEHHHHHHHHQRSDE